MKFFIVYALDGIDAILGNIFLDAYRVNVLRGVSNLRIIAKLKDMFVNLEVEL
jgi:hypothetical protein